MQYKLWNKFPKRIPSWGQKASFNGLFDVQK